MKLWESPIGSDIQTEMDIITDNINCTEFNVKMKQKSLLGPWVKSDPVSILLMIAMVMKPVQALLYRFRSRVSKDSEKKEKAKAAWQQPRTYFVLPVGRMSDLKKFRSDLDERFQAAPIHPLP